MIKSELMSMITSTESDSKSKFFSLSGDERATSSHKLFR